MIVGCRFTKIWILETRSHNEVECAKIAEQSLQQHFHSKDRTSEGKGHSIPVQCMHSSIPAAGDPL